MAIKGDRVGLYLASRDIAVQQCGILIKQPTVREVLMFGEEDFLSVLQLFNQLPMFADTLKKDNPVLQEAPDFQILLLMCQQDAMVRHQLENFFELVCPDYEVKFADAAIEFQQEKQLRGQLHPFNFEFFQKTIKELFDPYSAQKEEYNPKSDKAKEIARKLKEGKERKAKQQQGDTSQSLFGTYLSILSIGIQTDINVLLEYTPFQLYDAFERFALKESQDYYKMLSSSGFLDTSKVEEPESWLKNLYD